MNDNQSGVAEALAAAGLASGDVSDRAPQVAGEVPAANMPTRCTTR